MIRSDVLRAGLRVVMEALWISALLVDAGAAIRSGEAILPFPAVLLLLLAATATGRFLQHLDLSDRFLRGLALGSALFWLPLIIGGVRTGVWAPFNLPWIADLVRFAATSSDQHWVDIVSAAVGLGLWWRGSQLAEDELSFDTTLSAFRAGLVLMVVALLISVGNGRQGDVGPFAFLFFATGLMALAVAHLARLMRGERLTLPRYWLGVLPGIIAVIVLLALILPFGLGSQFARPIAVIWGGIDAALLGILYVVLLPFALGAEFLFNLIRSWLGPGQALNLDLSFMQTLQQVQEQTQPVERETPLLLRLLPWAVATGISALALWWLSTLYRRFRRRTTAAGELRESFFSLDTLRRDLRSLLRHILSPETILPQPQSSTLSEEARAVRRLYYQLLTVAAARGLRRATWQTPSEFEPPLQEEFPPDAVDHLTHAFTAARYGDRVPAPDELERLRADWLRIERNQE